MKKVLITGGNGFIGKNLREFLESSYEVLAPSHSELELLDENSVKSYLKQHSFDIVLHTATHNATATSTKDTSKVLESNLKMFFNLAENRELYGKMIHFGSGAEFSREHYIPKMSEEYLGEHIPSDQYGFSKYIAARFTDELKGNIYNLRCFGVFGKYEDHRIRFISNNIWNVLQGNSISLNQNVHFDYLYIEDLCRIVSWFLENEPIYNTYNVCTGKTVDLYSIAETIREVMNTDLPIVVKQPGFKNEYSGDNSRLMKELGSFEYTDIKKSIESLVVWYSNLHEKS